MSEISKIKKSNRAFPTKTKEILYNSVNECNEILKKSPNDLDALRTKGIYLQELCFYNPEHIESAIACFDRVLQINNEDKEVLKRKAALLSRKETINQAMEYYDKVLKLDPQDSEAWWGKGVITQLDGKPYLAIPYFDKALELDPLDARSWMQKGFALSARRETWDQALECFTKALEINSDDSRVWKGKGDIIHKKNDLDNAIFHYNKAISLDPSDWESLLRKGFALAGKNDFENAIKCFDESLSIKPNNIEVLRGKGNALYSINKYKDALDTYEIITQISPKSSDGWLQKGFCFLKLNNEQKALYNFEMALKINPQDIIAQKERRRLVGERIESEKTISNKVNQSFNQDSAIIVNGIYKSFKIHHEKRDSVFSLLANSFSKNNFEVIDILKDISFNLNRGEMLGVIGRNGSGKTTLLRILSGIIKPDRGNVKINGKLAPLLQLGVGFNGELTARENIILSGMLLGFSKVEIKKKVDDIIKFAELEKFSDTKIKNFSSGMHSRLAFSTAIQIDPDILLVDEVLAVGDINFVKKSYREFLSFREKGKSIIFVSHSLDHIRNLCDRAMILDSGEIKMIGKPDDVIQYYMGSNS